ncbi:coiled-coil domain-containing protein 60 isoform X2 [Xenopus tropicalis]|uniref:Coiled-coil domain containing 60 n=1 Tax=Xenopus tropicalis TaxID=8364 RepID=A0A803K256_XENTR|nr:coiled-coil domain-containing protein 60 isoform X2 [Xenopus tropicalis]
MPGNQGYRDPQTFVLIKPLPVASQKGLKIQARSPTYYSCWEANREGVFRANYLRRQKQLSQQGYNSPINKPYEDLGQPLILEAKKFILHSLGQDEQEPKSEKEAIENYSAEDSNAESIPKISKGEMAASFGTTFYLRQRKKDKTNFNNEFQHTRLFLTEVKEKRRKESKSMRRPFTPIHHSLLSSHIFDADLETLFRQLCALHWLLESLTLEPSSAIRPVSSCWNLSKCSDAGGSKTPVKKITRENNADLKWDQLQAGKGKKMSQKTSRQCSASFRSISRISGRSSAIGSESSLTPNSEEMAAGGVSSSDCNLEGADAIESAVTSVHGKLSKEADKEPLSEYLQKLIEMIAESIKADLDEEESQKKCTLLRAPSAQTEDFPVREDQQSNRILLQRPKSSPATTLYPSNLVTKKKQAVFSKMRDMFFEVAADADTIFHDKVEARERRCQEVNIQKYRSLDSMQNFHQDLEKMRNAYHYVKEDRDYKDKNNWFVVLMSRIPQEMMKNHKIHNIVNKLEKLEEKLFVRIRPSAFLKFLEGLRTWELCSPDVSVAIEFVREHLIQMPLEEYTAWLNARLACFTSTGRVQSAPPRR